MGKCVLINFDLALNLCTKKLYLENQTDSERLEI